MKRRPSPNTSSLFQCNPLGSVASGDPQLLCHTATMMTMMTNMVMLMSWQGTITVCFQPHALGYPPQAAFIISYSCHPPRPHAPEQA